MWQILTDTSKITPAYVRFSTVGGSRGSADSVRDPRGFAARLYTDEGNWDLVGNNMPVFHIQGKLISQNVGSLKRFLLSITCSFHRHFRREEGLLTKKRPLNSPISYTRSSQSRTTRSRKLRLRTITPGTLWDSTLRALTCRW